MTELPNDVLDYMLMNTRSLQASAVFSTINKHVRNTWCARVAKVISEVRSHLPRCHVSPAPSWKAPFENYDHIIVLDVSTKECTDSFINYFVVQGLDAAIIWRAVKPEQMPLGPAKFVIWLKNYNSVRERDILTDIMTMNKTRERFGEALKRDGINIKVVSFKLDMLGCVSESGVPM